MIDNIPDILRARSAVNAFTNEFQETPYDGVLLCKFTLEVLCCVLPAVEARYPAAPSEAQKECKRIVKSANRLITSLASYLRKHLYPHTSFDMRYTCLELCKQYHSILQSKGGTSSQLTKLEEVLNGPEGEAAEMFKNVGPKLHQWHPLQT